MTMTAYHQTSRFFSQLSCLLMTFLVSAALIIPLRGSAAENQPPGSDMKEHREMKKIPPRQFVINIEKKENIIFLFIFPAMMILTELLIQRKRKSGLKQNRRCMRPFTMT
ncbi:hypothetical protein [Salmonella enterica]|uniref:hypothetical protein n=1 Tax=Salmonella enterica TaxID=28901 RepID=UPI00234D7EAF|nr:hypothetical protein [Salmonella enterica]HCZ5349370.1 hypothetical protein [Salmonella enterica]